MLTVLVVAALAIAGPPDLAIRNRDIVLYEKRVREDPTSSADFSQLAGLYLQRAREAGDYEDFRRAERAARRSWEMRGKRNGKALHMLASALLAQHKFVAARTAAEQLVALDPDIMGWSSLLAEIQLELGDYEAVRASFARLERYRRDLAVAPRLARWYEINGRNEAARALLEQARDLAIRRADLPREQIAWFYLRTADWAVRNGKLRMAMREAKRGLRINPGDVRLISLQARVAYEKHDWKRVAALVQPIIERADIATLSMLGDAYVQQRGGYAIAQNIYGLVEARAAQNPEPFNRQWTQFRLDHGRDLPATLAILEREVRIRPDVLGYDQLAWAYHLLGRSADARAAIAQALRMHTRDRNLQRHTQAIRAS